MRFLKPLLQIGTLFTFSLSLSACGSSSVSVVSTTTSPTRLFTITPELKNQTNTSILEPIDTINPDKIILSVPFDKQDPPFGLIPMGETVYHPKPQNPMGHPGIDFQWDHQAPILASVGGEIIDIEKGESWVNLWDVRIRSGIYQISYTELESYNPELIVGIKIKVGTLIGYPQHPDKITDQPKYRMIHWEFGYFTGSKYPDRLCPMNYFDATSRAILETIWANTQWEYKKDFPNICSGDYENKNR